MQNYRFAVLKCDEDTKKSIANYKKSGLEFFSQDESLKLAWVGRNEKQENSEIEEFRKRKVNKGYVLVEKCKEFLKVIT